jgi:hypothetical protein
MMTFVLAAAVLVGALCVAVALDDATTEAPPDGVAHNRQNEPRRVCRRL